MDSSKPAWLPLLRPLLGTLAAGGQLSIIDWRGRCSSFGDRDVPQVTIRLHDRWLPVRLALAPSLAAGEAYINGRLTIEAGNLGALMELVGPNIDRARSRGVARVFARAYDRLRSWLPRNARANIAYHYDLPLEFYALFLDADRHYSCAYFATGNETLEAAQHAKVHHLASKLVLRPHLDVLDIGCGWGALALALARAEQVAVTGITLSEPQRTAAETAARRDHLNGMVHFALRDYRDERGNYDRIVSVGMLEHVGRAGLDDYFAMIARCLRDDGIAVVHAIGRSDVDGTVDAWTDRHVFPGAYVPSLSEVTGAAERSGLVITDIEVLRLHYAKTLHCWAERFAARRETARAMLGERFCRLWEFYLAAAETTFRHRPLMVFQVQLAHHADAVPLTRDYITDGDRLRTTDPAAPSEDVFERASG